MPVSIPTIHPDIPLPPAAGNLIRASDIVGAASRHLQAAEEVKAAAAGIGNGPSEDCLDNVKASFSSCEADLVKRFKPAPPAPPADDNVVDQLAGMAQNIAALVTSGRKLEESVNDIKASQRENARNLAKYINYCLGNGRDRNYEPVEGLVAGSYPNPAILTAEDIKRALAPAINNWLGIYEGNRPMGNILEKKGRLAQAIGLSNGTIYFVSS